MFIMAISKLDLVGYIVTLYLMIQLQVLNIKMSYKFKGPKEVKIQKSSKNTFLDLCVTVK